MTEVEFREVTRAFAKGATVGPMSFDVARGQLLCLVGPSGCGKSTTLRMLGGFEQPDGGDILFRGRSMVGVPPHKRGIGFVFQSYALFPHMTVAENIAFGPRRGGVPRRETKRRVDRLLGMLHLEPLRARRPDTLSGGERQRVAIARALAIEPPLVLLDEPFSSLDARLRETTRAELRTLQREIGFTAILVTHDQQEALAISDQVAVMHAGKLLQLGRPAEVYRRPASGTVAALTGSVAEVRGGLIRPEDIRLVEAVAALDTGTVGTIAFRGADAELRIVTDRGTVIDLLARARQVEGLQPGSVVHLAWDASAILTPGETARHPSQPSAPN